MWSQATPLRRATRRQAALTPAAAASGLLLSAANELACVQQLPTSRNDPNDAEIDIYQAPGLRASSVIAAQLCQRAILMSSKNNVPLPRGLATNICQSCSLPLQGNPDCKASIAPLTRTQARNQRRAAAKEQPPGSKRRNTRALERICPVCGHKNLSLFFNESSALQAAGLGTTAELRTGNSSAGTQSASIAQTTDTGDEASGAGVLVGEEAMQVLTPPEEPATVAEAKETRRVLCLVGRRQQHDSSAPAEPPRPLQEQPVAVADVPSFPLHPMEASAATEAKTTPSLAQMHLTDKRAVAAELEPSNGCCPKAQPEAATPSGVLSPLGTREGAGESAMDPSSVRREAAADLGLSEGVLRELAHAAPLGEGGGPPAVVCAGEGKTVSAAAANEQLPPSESHGGKQGDNALPGGQSEGNPPMPTTGPAQMLLASPCGLPDHNRLKVVDLNEMLQMRHRPVGELMAALINHLKDADATDAARETVTAQLGAPTVATEVQPFQTGSRTPEADGGEAHRAEQQPQQQPAEGEGLQEVGSYDKVKVGEGEVEKEGHEQEIEVLLGQAGKAKEGLEEAGEEVGKDTVEGSGALPKLPAGGPHIPLVVPECPGGCVEQVLRPADTPSNLSAIPSEAIVPKLNLSRRPEGQQSEPLLPEDMAPLDGLGHEQQCQTVSVPAPPASHDASTSAALEPTQTSAAEDSQHDPATGQERVVTTGGDWTEELHPLPPASSVGLGSSAAAWEETTARSPQDTGAHPGLAVGLSMAEALAVEKGSDHPEVNLLSSSTAGGKTTPSGLSLEVVPVGPGSHSGAGEVQQDPLQYISDPWENGGEGPSKELTASTGLQPPGASGRQLSPSQEQPLDKRLTDNKLPRSEETSVSMERGPVTIPKTSTQHGAGHTTSIAAEAETPAWPRVTSASASPTHRTATYALQHQAAAHPKSDEQRSVSGKVRKRTRGLAFPKEALCDEELVRPPAASDEGTAGVSVPPSSRVVWNSCGGGWHRVGRSWRPLPPRHRKLPVLYLNAPSSLLVHPLATMLATTTAVDLQPPAPPLLLPPSAAQPPPHSQSGSGLFNSSQVGEDPPAAGMAAPPGPSLHEAAASLKLEGCVADISKSSKRQRRSNRMRLFRHSDLMTAAACVTSCHRRQHLLCQLWSPALFR